MSQTAPEILAPLDISKSTEEQENFIDAAIDQLNLSGAPTITNMAGAVGSKTVTLTSKQRAAIRYVARVVYGSYNKNPKPTTSTVIGQLSLSQSDLFSNATVLAAIERAAAQLRDDGELPFVTFSEFPRT